MNYIFYVDSRVLELHIKGCRGTRSRVGSAERANKLKMVIDYIHGYFGANKHDLKG